MIEFINVTYSIVENGMEKTILNNFSYKFKKGLTTAITGPNGGGKSTITKLIMGIFTPTTGKILYNGKDITNLSVDKRANLGINYAFQKPINFKGITVKDLIDIAAGKENTVSQACTYLSKVGLCAKEYINREFDDTLSGGEQKRIELAIALAKKGNCYVFDEPEAGIDMWSFDKLKDIFENNKTIIIVSHQEKLLKSANEIVVVERGKIKHCGKAKEVLDAVNNLKCKRIVGGENGIK